MSTLRITLRQMQIFRAVAETGSTSAAAVAISLSQSAASAAIGELERLLGLLLFDRVGKRMLLNDNGRSLLPRALALLDAAAGIEQWAADGSAQIGALRIGASTTIGNYLLPMMLADFRRSLPKAAVRNWNIQVAIANTEAIIERVANFDLDLGLIEGSCSHEELIVEPWIDDEMVIVAAADDPQWKKRRRRVSLADLQQACWLLREAGSGTREIVSQLLMPHLHQLRTGIEFGNSEAIKRAVAGGLGISCLSHCVVADGIRAGELVELRTPLPRLLRRLHRISNRRKQMTHGLEVFGRFIAGVAAETAVRRTGSA